MKESLRIIRDEHAGYRSVMHCLEGVVRDIEAGRIEPDFVLLEAVLEYFSGFLGRLHHPKEDDHLFRLLRGRHPPADALLAELEAEHVLGGQLGRTLAAATARYREEGLAAFPAFRDALTGYLRFERNHMRREEDEILPLAEAHLTPADWAEIDASFLDHDDPVFGDKPRDEFRGLLAAIAARAPAPHGYGRS